MLLKARERRIFEGKGIYKTQDCKIIIFFNSYADLRDNLLKLYLIDSAIFKYNWDNLSVNAKQFLIKLHTFMKLVFAIL